MKFLFVTVFVFACSTLPAQSFTGETGYIYTGNTNKEFYGTIDIKSGVLKKTDQLDIFAGSGRKFQASIKKMTIDGTEVQSAKAGAYVTIDFVTAEDATTGNDYLRKGYLVLPRNFKGGVSNPENASGYPDKFTATLGGKPYRAACFNNGYYPGGIKGVSYGLPFIQFSIVNNNRTDTRSFLVQIFNPSPAPGVYGTASTEVNLSGSEDGKKEHEIIYGYMKGAAEKFKIQITQWEKQSGGRIIVSGKMEGTLTQVTASGKKEVIKLENGVFENVEVFTYTNPAVPVQQKQSQ